MPFRFTDIAMMMPRAPQAPQSGLGNLFMEFAAQQLQQRRAEEQQRIQREQLAQQARQFGENMAQSRAEQDRKSKEWDAVFKRQTGQQDFENETMNRKERKDMAIMQNQLQQNGEMDLARRLTGAEFQAPGSMQMSYGVPAGEQPPPPPQAVPAFAQSPMQQAAMAGVYPGSPQMTPGAMGDMLTWGVR